MLFITATDIFYTYYIMKISIIQTNPKTGDIQGNKQQIISKIEEASQTGAELVVFPEYALSGVNAKDLMKRKNFFKEINSALKEIAKQAKKINVILGTARIQDSSIYDSAVLISCGDISYINKTALSLDESFYMDNSASNNIFEINGERILITLGDDVMLNYLYAAKPSITINLSSKYYLRNKIAGEIKELISLAKKNKTFMVSANLVGGNDEYVYYGNSCVINPEGKMLAAAASFDEDFILTDTNLPVFLNTSKRNDTEDLANALTLGLKNYFTKQGFQKAVLGLSGGMDSALVAALAVRAIGSENLKVVLLPSEFTSKQSIDDSVELAKNLNIAYQIIPIKDMYNAFVKNIKPKSENGNITLTMQNLQARMRGASIMAIANEENRLVLATGNKSEIAMGYCTMYGDTVGAIDPIADIFKTEVYELAEYLNAEGMGIPQAIISRPPSAELKPNQKDQDDLPPYSELDEIINLYTEQGKSEEDIIKKKFSKDFVQKAIRRIECSEYKRRQFPMGIKVAKYSFFTDRNISLVCKSY